jgi:hypothetical protein
MDDKHLKQILTEIAQQEIDPEMNLWPEIQSKLGKPVSQPRYTALRLLRVAAVIALLVVTTAAAYAVYQELVPDDPGLSAMNDEIIYLDQTQPIETDAGRNLNLQVTLQYAYADANRITVAYEVTGEARAGDEVQIYVNPTLTDSANRQYVWLPVGGGGGGGGGAAPDEIVQFRNSGLANFDASVLENVPETLDLNLKIEVAYANAELRQQDPYGMLFAGDTLFSFALPLAPGRVMETPQTSSAAGIEMTVQKVVVAPSMTRVELCYPAPDVGEQMWTPFGTLEIGGEVMFEAMGFNVAGLGGLPLNPDDECRALIIPEALQDIEGEWRLTIEALRQEGSVDVEALAQRLSEEYDVEITPLPEGGFSVRNDQPLPEGFDLGAAIAELEGELAEQIVGPWRFTFSFPN